MINTLKFLLKYKLRSSHLQGRNYMISGLTMIELLVGTIMAFLIITPLFGLVIGLLNDDQREEAKANTEQELQSALDYISEDLSQAVHIYDRTGVNALNDAQGIQQTNKTPILVFWKRTQVADILPVTSDVTCPPTTSPPAGQLDDCDDTFVFSLVVYYITHTQETNSPWSNQARIERLEISDGVKNPDPATQATQEYLPNAQPSDGFDDINTQDWNAWTKDLNKGFKDFRVLIDYIDKSTSGVPVPTDATCTAALGSSTAQLISDGSSYSFYACVDTDKNVGQVNMRLNALARIQPNDATYKVGSKAYFPTGNIIVRGLSGFGQ